MKGKNKKRRKIGKAILLAMSFVMTVVLTFTITLAWFYDSDWASNSVTMGGAVGIELREKETVVNPDGLAAEAGSLHFVLADNAINGRAYPGQGVEVQASVFNNGGRSIEEHFSGSSYTDEDILDAGSKAVGSSCYVRAHFAVYTNIGIDTGVPEGEDDPDQSMNSRYLYDFMYSLVTDQNEINADNYQWVYYQNPNAAVNFDRGIYMNGEYKTSTPANTDDAGYYYLCTSGSTSTSNAVLKQLNVGEEAAFLWNGTFIIPWQLTNTSADRYIFVAVTFQAIQTFIPKMEIASGNNYYSIIKSKDNQLPAEQCTILAPEVQIVFNTCAFTPIDYKIKVGEDTLGNDIIINFADGTFSGTSVPSSGATASS